MNIITPCLWFDFQLEEALEFYQSIFPDLEIFSIHLYPEATPEIGGKILTARFRMANQEFIGINGGPMYKFTEAVSFSVACKNQEEIDYYWNKLTEAGQESMCGWLKDKYGLSWQIVPFNLDILLYHPDPEKSRQAMEALFRMKKIEIKKLT